MRLREVSRSELVEQYILENIVAARNPGDRIPSEAALSKEIGVAVPTVNKILASLTDRGILFRKKGLGTYVAEQSPKGKVVRVITQSAKKYIPGSTVSMSSKDSPEPLANMESSRKHFSLTTTVRSTGKLWMNSSLRVRKDTSIIPFWNPTGRGPKNSAKPEKSFSPEAINPPRSATPSAPGSKPPIWKLSRI